MQNVTDPREVIDFLREDKNRNLFGVGREITYYFFNKSRHGCCVQLRQFFRGYGNGVTLHYEIDEYAGGIGVEIHSEPKTPKDVHEFMRRQFQYEPKRGHDETGSYRFAIQEIEWQGRSLDDVIVDVKAAVDELYRKYDAYLNYVEGYYAGKGTIDGCVSYRDFIREIN